ncbi:hypothetical protein BU26DRAFT_344892 [Trematosphaeria pertusa]|uniref:Uncharacterized protein n=1 Tax=Trematosphaeria pertusa TaxID=390896 RepID=A0A6A6ICH1_9PLEO|nr:uncharacterized protein BU26DRAFT_344892 [Trematosphaeria pertusa]KAF2247250.1 hypothetical protein BU26DRAFT_344892 [Trematosphaeria pertusa]
MRFWRTDDFRSVEVNGYGAPEWFARDLVAGIAKCKGEGRDRWNVRFSSDLSNTCRYHEHARLGRPCYKSRRPF